MFVMAKYAEDVNKHSPRIYVHSLYACVGGRYEIVKVYKEPVA